MGATEPSLLKFQEVPIQPEDTKDVAMGRGFFREEDEEMPSAAEFSAGGLGMTDDETSSAEATRTAAMEKILDFIALPREIEKENQRYRIQVSREPATRDDVLNLADLLEQYQQKRKARPVGLCPIRRELYDQCFDELIRQSTIRSAERGALLLRVRDELRMTIAAYEALYESGVAYGLRKSLEAETREKGGEEQVRQLEAEIRKAKEKMKELEARIEQAVKVSAEQKAINQSRHQEKMEYLRKTNEQLKDQLDMMMKK